MGICIPLGIEEIDVQLELSAGILYGFVLAVSGAIVRSVHLAIAAVELQHRRHLHIAP
jgi:hypothetical protein